MTEYKIQSHDDLKDEMMAVARGEKPAPKDAALPSFNSIDALLSPAICRIGQVGPSVQFTHEHLSGAKRTGFFISSSEEKCFAT